MALFDNMSKGDALAALVKFAGAKVVHDTLSSLATKGECVEAIGAALYADEAEDAARKPWTGLTVKEKRVWARRATVAVLGLRDHVLNRR